MTDLQETKDRKVKGILLLDYIKMLRANPNLPWKKHLSAEDLKAVQEMVLPGSWYPIMLFQRIGRAVFKLLIKEDDEQLRNWGRISADRMVADNPSIISPGQGRDTLRRYRAIHDRLYSFKAVDTEELSPNHVIFRIYSVPEETEGIRLLITIITGSADRLLELTGGKNIKIKVLEATWLGNENNILDVTWEE